MGDIWSYNDGNGRLKDNYTSSITGVMYPAGSDIAITIINDAETKKFHDAVVAEQKKKRAAAAAKAWSAAQSSASGRAELDQIKAAQAYERSLQEAEAAKKSALAAAAKASAQHGHIAAIKAQTAEIKANTARNIAAQTSPVEFSQGMPAEVKQDVQNAAQASQENAKMQEEINYLPEVQVKSDFSKYLLWGGVAVLAFYILKKKKG